MNGQLPTSLDGISVSAGGKPAYMYYVSPTVINFVVPDIAVGPQQVVVTNGTAASLPYRVPIATYSPAFFDWPGSQAVATRPDYSWAVRNGTFSGVTTIPAKPGDIIVFWATRFGPTTPAYTSGIQVPADQIYSTSTAPVVKINNVAVKVLGAALTPGSAALYQIAIQVPSPLADGDYPVTAIIGGVSSPGATILTVKN